MAVKLLATRYIDDFVASLSKGFSYQGLWKRMHPDCRMRSKEYDFHDNTDRSGPGCDRSGETFPRLRNASLRASNSS